MSRIRGRLTVAICVWNALWIVLAVLLHLHYGEAGGAGPFPWRHIGTAKFIIDLSFSLLMLGDVAIMAVYANRLSRMERTRRLRAGR